jgi:hypothetical protein
MRLTDLWGTERTSSFYAHLLQTPLCPHSEVKTPWRELQSQRTVE